MLAKEPCMSSFECLARENNAFVRLCGECNNRGKTKLRC